MQDGRRGELGEGEEERQEGGNDEGGERMVTITVRNSPVTRFYGGSQVKSLFYPCAFHATLASQSHRSCIASCCSPKHPFRVLRCQSCHSSGLTSAQHASLPFLSGMQIKRDRLHQASSSGTPTVFGLCSPTPIS